MNMYAQEIKALQNQVQGLNKEIEALSKNYNLRLQDKSIPVIDRWKMLVEHPNYKGSKASYSDDFECELLREVYDMLLCVIELGGSTEYIRIQDALLMLVLEKDGTIKKSKLAELGDFSEKDVHDALEEIFERQISYVAL